MKLGNPFRSLTWSSFFKSSRRPLRRRRAGSLAVNVAAEVLEVRSLLSAANVAATVAGTALTLTSDNNGDHKVNVYRLDSTHIEVDASAAGTTINGGAFAVFTLPSVSGITVNLGPGADTYHVYSKSGNPALNVGGGGILFQGAGGTVDDLEVYNESANAMTIAGNVAVHGSSPGAALALNGATESQCDLAAEGSGGLTVSGSVFFNIQGAGTGPQYNQLYTLGSGSLNVLGAVAEMSSQSSSGFQSNEVFANGSGNLLIGGGVFQTTTGGSGAAQNSVAAAGSPGNVKIGGAVMQSAQGGSGASSNTVSAFSNIGGSISIGFGVTQSATSSNHDARNEVSVDGSGNIAIGTLAGGISQTAISSSGANAADNDVYTDASGTGSLSVGGKVVQVSSSSYAEANHLFNNGTGNLTVGLQLVQSGALSTSHGTENLVYNKSSAELSVGLSVSQSAYGASSIDNRVDNFLDGAMVVGSSITQMATASSGVVSDKVYTYGNGNLTVGGGITINESDASPTSDGYNMVYTQGTGRLSVAGLITIEANNSGAGLTLNSVETSGAPEGTLSAAGVLIVDAGSQNQENDVLGEGAGITIGALGIRNFGLGSGAYDNEIATNIDNSPITINGAVTVIDAGNGHSTFAITAGANNSFISVGGNVNYYNAGNTTAHSAVDLHGDISLANSIVTIAGSLSLNLASTSGTVADNAGFDHNLVYLGSATSDAGYGLCVDGAVLITGGNGQDEVLIQQAQFKLGGTINLKGNPIPGPAWRDILLIDGSAIGGALTVAMSGPNAQINVNNGLGFQPDVFSGQFVAFLSGVNPVIYVADGSGTGYSPVKFSAGATVVGAPGGGGIIEYHVANVTGTINAVNFTKVPV